MLRSHKKLTKKELKQDSLVIFTAQAIDYLRDKWMKIGGIIVGIVVIVAVTLFIIKGKERSEINALDTAMNAFNNNAPEAMDLLKKFVENYSGSERAAGAMIQIGNHFYSQKDYDSAEIYYMEYIKNFSKDPIYGFNAYNSLGAIYEEKGEYGKAGEIYEEFLENYENSPFEPIMRLNAGKAYFLDGERDASIRNLNIIINNYSDSKEKQEAIFYKGML